MNDKPRDFDKDAVNWDENAGRVKMAFNIAISIIGAVPLNAEMDMLDFGCGTGLLTLRLQPLVRSIIGVDSSAGMLAVLENKIQMQRLTNIQTKHLDVEKGGVLTGAYELVVSSMTLHHVREIKPLLAQFYKVMKPGGYLCLADLDPDNGHFHGNNAGVFHFGFDHQALRQDIAVAGFSEIDFRQATEIVRFYPGGVRPFAIFLVTARK
ncbi:MAG: class I SAM-dependent methyltransferase [Firmicutes bacterium]|nr:class I SAM-dependent methyltransferase [Bacillota bacterium]